MPDIDSVGKRHPVALLAHGAGQRYRGLNHRSWDGGAGRERVGLFLCPNDGAVAANLEVYPTAEGAAVGCPALDRHLGVERPRNERPVVAVTFHWWAQAVAASVPELRPAVDHYKAGLPEIVGRLRAEGCDVVGHAHPRFRSLLRWWRKMGVEIEPDWEALLPRLDCLVADNTSVGWECQALGVPTVWLNAPWFRRDVEQGLRFWKLADRQVDHPGEVVSAVLAALSDGPERPRAVAGEVYGPLDGRATDRAVEALTAWAGQNV